MNISSRKLQVWRCATQSSLSKTSRTWGNHNASFQQPLATRRYGTVSRQSRSSDSLAEWPGSGGLKEADVYEDAIHPPNHVYLAVVFLGLHAAGCDVA